MRVIGSVMAFRAHGHTPFSDLMFYHRKKSLCAAKEKVENVKGDLKRKRRYRRCLRLESTHFCISSASGSTVVILVEEIFSTRWFRRW